MKLLVLDSVDKSITAVMSGAPATTQPDFVVTYADSTSSNFLEAPNHGTLNGTTPVTLVAAPAASTRRLVNGISIFNRDTAAVTIQINYLDTATSRRVWAGTLQAGERVTLDGVYDAYGSLKMSVGLVDVSAISGVLPVSKGGSGANLSSTGGSNQFVKQSSAGGNLSVGTIALADLPSGIPDSGLLTPRTAISGATVTISIPSQAFNTLLVTLELRSTQAATVSTLRVKLGDATIDTTAANFYSRTNTFYGAAGSITGSENTGTNAYFDAANPGASAPSGSYSFIQMYIHNYSTASRTKFVKMYSQYFYATGSAGMADQLISGWWLNTSKNLTQIELSYTSGDVASGSAYTIQAFGTP